MTQNRYVDRSKLMGSLHYFLFHNEDVLEKVEDGKIVVPEEQWLYFVRDMGIALGFYLNKASEYRD